MTLKKSLFVTLVAVAAISMSAENSNAFFGLFGGGSCGSHGAAEVRGAVDGVAVAAGEAAVRTVVVVPGAVAPMVVAGVRTAATVAGEVAVEVGAALAATVATMVIRAATTAAAMPVAVA